MNGLQPLLAFAETAKRGSFAAAARELGCSPSALAKAVSRLEVQLKLRLFHRTTRQVTLTDDGERLYERCRRVLNELELLEREATGAREAPSGTLRIDMPVAFGRIVMLPLLQTLAKRYPELGIDARMSDLYVDLVKDGIDVAIRTGRLRDSSLVARRFASQDLLLFASPDYLQGAGMPKSVKDLDRHRAILFRVPSSGRDRPFQCRVRGRPVELLPPSKMRLDHGDAIVRAATLGLGIGQVPHYMVTEALASGALVEVLPECRPEPMPIAAVMPSARGLPARVRVLLELLEASRESLPKAPPLPT